MSKQKHNKKKVALRNTCKSRHKYEQIRELFGFSPVDRFTTKEI